MVPFGGVVIILLVTRVGRTIGSFLILGHNQKTQ